MDLVSKYDLIQKIVNTDNEIILSQVKNLLEEESAESWESLDLELKVSLKRGIAQAKAGKVSSHAEVMKRLQKRRSK